GTREPGVFIETLATAGEMLDEGIDEHVGRAGVEGKDLRRFRGSREDGDVGDAAEVERDAAEFGVAVEEIVDVGNERGALAAEGDVGGTKVSHSSDAGSSGDDRGLADLESGSSRSAEVGSMWRVASGEWRARSHGTLVEDGLTVGADERNFLG